LKESKPMAVFFLCNPSRSSRVSAVRLIRWFLRKRW